MTRWLDAVTFGPQRRARRMMRQLRELDAQDARLKAAGLDPLDEWLRGRDPRLAPAGAPLQPAARSPRRAALLAVVLTVAIGGLVAWHQYHGGPADGPRAVARPANLPPAGIEEQEIHAALAAATRSARPTVTGTSQDGAVTTIPWKRAASASRSS